MVAMVVIGYGSAGQSRLWPWRFWSIPSRKTTGDVGSRAISRPFFTAVV